MEVQTSMIVAAVSSSIAAAYQSQCRSRDLRRLSHEIAGLRQSVDELVAQLRDLKRQRQ